jgi:hypothetical protein
MKGEEIKVTRGKIGSPFFIFLFLYFSLLCVPFVGGQTVPEGGVPVAVMNFSGDETALSTRSRAVTIGELEKMANFAPWPLNAAGPQPDLPPDSMLLGGLPYALTGEYYYDTEDMQHFQLWLWNSGTGALVYTDELVAEDIDEAVGYLPALVAWVFSQIPLMAVERSASVPAVKEEAPAGEETVEEAPGKPPFPRLYLGLRAGEGLDFQSVRPYGDYGGGMGQSFGGELALTVEFRPWRFVSFQAEGILATEAFGAYRLDSDADRYTNDHYRGSYLLFPLLVKAPFDLRNWRLSPLAGVYFVVPLGKNLGGASYKDTVDDLPLGLMAGLDVGYALFGGRFGEIYGSLRYGLDLGLTAVEQTGLYYTRNRLILSVGWKIEMIKREK